MDTNAPFTMAIGLQAPWEVKSLDFNAADRRLDILVDFQRGASFPCPACAQPSKVHDTEEKTWRHLDFFQHSAYLTARVPRCKCEEHGVKVTQPKPSKNDASTDYRALGSLSFCAAGQGSLNIHFKPTFEGQDAAKRVGRTLASMKSIKETGVPKNSPLLPW